MMDPKNKLAADTLQDFALDDDALENAAGGLYAGADLDLYRPGFPIPGTVNVDEENVLR